MVGGKDIIGLRDISFIYKKNGSHLGFLPFIIILEKKGLFDRIKHAKLPFIARFGE